MSFKIKKAYILSSIEMLRVKQDHPEISECQINVVIALVQMENTLNQLPTGAGKTWLVVCFPQILDILRDNFGYKISVETRVLYVVPLVNLYHSLAKEMKALEIKFQVMNAGSSAEVDREAKVIFVSPERLQDKAVMSSILKLSWSCCSIDEPHLALEWGISKLKHRRPFREAFNQLNNLNNLGTVFEMHSATIDNVEALCQLVGRKNSRWTKQLEVPERSNLTYYLFAGKTAPTNILQVPFIKESLEDDLPGIILVYVQSIQEGSSIYMSILDYCEKHNLIRFPTKETIPNLPVSFLHSNLTEEKKKEVIENASACKIKILVATSAAGDGINLPIVKFVGWGLDREPSGIVQSQGRTARNPFKGEGTVIWVHNPKLHGRRISGSSKVREVLTTDCFRKTINSWFCHGLPLVEHSKLPEFCCSLCMAACVEKTSCRICQLKLDQFKPSLFLNNLEAEKALTEFLVNLSLNKDCVEHKYSELSLSQEIIKNAREMQSLEEVKELLSIFSLGYEVTDKICTFMMVEIVPLLMRSCKLSNNVSSDATESCSSSDPSDSSDAADTDEEYFDSSESD